MVAALFAASVPPFRSISMRSAVRPRDKRDRIVPIGTSSIVAASSYNAFETDQENYLALLLTNPGERAIAFW